MKKAYILPVLLLAIALCIPAASAAENMVKIRVDNGKSLNHVAFYYVYGDHVEWWQGGAKFVFKPGTPEYEAIEEFLLSLPDILGIRVLSGEIRLVEGYLEAQYAFDGIIEFKDYMFIDHDGLIVVEWEHGKSLNVTIYAKATVNETASNIRGYGFADWEQRIVGYGVVCDPMLGCRRQPIYDSTPIAEIPAGSEVLVVPVEGVVLKENYRGYDQYLGGGPNLKRVDVSKRIRGGQIFWDREPDYWLVYDADGLDEIWKVDNWFNEAVLIWPIPHEVKVVEAR